MKTERNVEIDCLRAIAVVITVMAHMRLLFLWNPDWLMFLFKNAVYGNGVDLFFVISGFVITRSLQNNFLESSKFHLEYKNFIIRRFWRLAPAALFFCLFYLVYSLFSFSGEVGSFLLNLKNTVAVITMTANMRDQSNLMAVYWTLASEWQFYILFPILLLLAKRHTKTARYVLLITMGCLFAFAGTTKFVALRFDCMLYGVLLAFLLDTSANRIYEPTFMKNRFVSCGVSFFSIFLLIFLPIALSEIPHSVLMGLVSLNCAFLVWISTYEKNYLLGGFFKKSLKYIGERSYSIYLAHGPALYLTHDLWYWWHDKTSKEVGGSYTLRYTLTFLLLLWGITQFGYHFLEKPFTKRMKKRKLESEVLPVRA